MAKTKSAKVVVRNVIRPKSRRAVDARLYGAMKRAYLKVLPKRPPGMTPIEVARRVRAHLPSKLYPSANKAGWWSKLVQLDLEARRIIRRSSRPPVRLYRA